MKIIKKNNSLQWEYEIVPRRFIRHEATYEELIKAYEILYKNRPLEGSEDTIHYINRDLFLEKIQESNGINRKAYEKILEIISDMVWTGNEENNAEVLSSTYKNNEMENNDYEKI